MISATTHHFRRERIDDVHSSLYRSILYAIEDKDETRLSIKRLRSLVADYIRNNNDLNNEISPGDNSRVKINEYCERVKKKDLPSGRPEVQALAIRGHLWIRLVSIKKTLQGDNDATFRDYGRYVSPFEDCTCILYDEERKNYDPLFIINKNDISDKQTIFKYNNQVAFELLCQFIREEFHCKKIHVYNYQTNFLHC